MSILVPPTPQKQEVILQGVAASPGVVHGLAHLFFHKDLEIPIFNIEPEQQIEEIARFEQALVKTRVQIHRVRSEVEQKLGQEEATIFDAHLLVLEDKALIEETIKEHKQYNYNIEYCFHCVTKRYIEAFDHIDDEYIRERVTDIRDVTKRVLHNLLGYAHAMPLHLTEPKILASEDISPSDTAGLDKTKLLAIVTDVGSRTSHAVIMARSLKVPAVVGLHNISLRLKKNDVLLVDGYEGVVIINPTEETLYRYGKLKAQKDHVRKIFESATPLPSETLDGVHIKLVANIEGPQDIQNVLAANLEGIGLFRTESVLLEKNGFLTEEEQFTIYKKVAQAIQPYPIVIRTLDLGGDKKISSLASFDHETNPFMGFRAIRFCLEHKNFFKEQLKAILRASVFGKIKIMYPMISSASEVHRANLILEEVKQELKNQNQSFDENIEVGCMVEIPSAALTLDLLSKVAKFFSIGSNDLIQYILAVDRGNDKIAHLYEPHNMAIIRILQKIIEDSQKTKTPISICGEIAADPIYIPLLIGLGAKELSIAPSAAAEVRYLIRAIHFEEVKKLAKKILKLEDPKDIFNTLQAFYNEKMHDLYI